MREQTPDVALISPPTRSRLELVPTAENGLKTISFIMLDRLVTIPRKRFEKRIGRISRAKLEEVHLRLIDFLGE
ncbi:MAG: type II toxin-antitoxin system PemK/MazF family toxin [Coriobacteriales bacterium]|jgi:mRNA-degrading endonuclease toxin of MazEF toxin-antitoxin module|nr:type II toxin-antitoxin system PemK/MazF family toxin [Coriobacteriales bacterium]